MSKRARVDADLVVQENENEQAQKKDKIRREKVTETSNKQQQGQWIRNQLTGKQEENEQVVQKHIGQHNVYNPQKVESAQKQKNVNLSNVVKQKQGKNRKTINDVDERVAQSHRRFAAYIASWRHEVFSQTQHGTPVIRKPSSLPPLSSLPLLLTSQHLSLFGAGTQTVGKSRQTKQEVVAQHPFNVRHNAHREDKIQPKISELVNEFFHRSSSTQKEQHHDSDSHNNFSKATKQITNSAPCTGVIYDTAMYAHRSSNKQEYERSLRLQRAIEHLTAIKLLQCCKLLPSRLASSRELRRAHSRNLIDYIDQIDFVLAIRAKPTPTPVGDQNQSKQSGTPHIGNSNNISNNKGNFIDCKERTNQVQSFQIGQDLYACSHTSHVAQLAAGCAIEAALAVWRNEVANAFALIRPPGHHAMRDAAKGFCFYNNVAVAVRAVQAFAAEHDKQTSQIVNGTSSNNSYNKDIHRTRVQTNIASYALIKSQVSHVQQQSKVDQMQSQSPVVHSKPVKIMIIDWDVHHCDGTQDIFYNDDSVLVVSIHQHGNKRGHILRKLPTEMKQTIDDNNVSSERNNVINNNVQTDYLSIDEVAQLMNSVQADTTKVRANATAASGNDVQNNNDVHDIFTTTRQSTRRRAIVDYNKLAQQLDELHNANNGTVANQRANQKQDADVAAAALFGVDLHSRHHHHRNQQKRQQHDQYRNKYSNDSSDSSSSSSSSTSTSSSQSWSSTYSKHVNGKDANDNNAVRFEGDSAGASFDSFTASISSPSYNSYRNKNDAQCGMDKMSLEMKADSKVRAVQHNSWQKLNGSNDTQQGSRISRNNNVISYDQSKDVVTNQVDNSNNNNHDDKKKAEQVGQLAKEHWQQQQQQKKQTHKRQQIEQQQEQLFYPASGHLYRIGGDVNHRARGRNINIPWPVHGMGDVQYIRIFYELILPAAVEFAPAMVFVSCGFDSASSDLLGSMRLTPSGYYLMTKLILEHFPRTVVVLQGGYNARNVALCSEAVLRALLQASNSAHTKLPPSRMLWNQTGKLIRNVKHTHAPY